MTLLERLAENNPTRTRSVHSNALTQKTLDAIKSNLEVILNSRKGCSLSSPDLGLEDFNDATAGSVDMCILIAQDIKTSIEAYEPRVLVDEVEYLPHEHNPLQIHFRMSCSIRVKGTKEKAEIELLLNSNNRQFRVS
jgi:type VI secretion system protein